MESDLTLAEAIVDGTLDLICPVMELRVCPGYHEIAARGSGVVRSDKHGRLYCHMVWQFHGVCHPVLRPDRAPGEMYAIDDHVMLVAHDELGREWRSSPMIVDVGGQIPLPHYRLRQQLSGIIHTRTRRHIDHSAVRILIPRSPRLPFDGVTEERRTVGLRQIGLAVAMDHHTHQIGEAKVEFRREKNSWLSVRATRDQAFMPDWAGLLCHALEFVTAQTMTPAVVRRDFSDREDLQLFSGPFWRFESPMPGPVRFAGPQGAPVWRLLELFFLYVQKNPDRSDALIEELAGIRRGAQGSFQTACLTLAVGIESLSSILLATEVRSGVDRDVRESIAAHVAGWPGDKSVRTRVVRMIQRLGEVSAADRLYSWAKQHGVPDALLDNWKRLRNARAHGKVEAEDQKLYDRYYGVIELHYRLVASKIGYDGPLTPTSERGWGQSMESVSPQQSGEIEADERGQS